MTTPRRPMWTPCGARAAILAGAALLALAAPRPAHARPDALPFEVAVVLRGCADAPFAADRLTESLEAELAFEPLATLTADAAPVRLWFQAPRCGDADDRVRVSVEVVGVSSRVELLAVAPDGVTREARSDHLARQAVAAIARVWLGVTAAAEGNPYVVGLPLVHDNPYRGAMARNGADRAREGVSLPPNPYRR